MLVQAAPVMIVSATQTKVKLRLPRDNHNPVIALSISKSADLGILIILIIPKT